jgi:hypothetical protein
MGFSQQNQTMERIARNIFSKAFLYQNKALCRKLSAETQTSESISRLPVRALFRLSGLPAYYHGVVACFIRLRDNEFVGLHQVGLNHSVTLRRYRPSRCSTKDSIYAGCQDFSTRFL